MESHCALRLALALCCILPFCSGQSGEDELLDTGSGSTLEEMKDSAQEFKNEVHDPDHCGLTFFTPARPESCGSARLPAASKEDLDYLNDLLKDTTRILQSLQYTTHAETGDLSYQEAIVESIKGTKEDNQEFHGTFNKVLNEFHTKMVDDLPDVGEEKKKLNKGFVMMDHMLRLNRRLAQQLDSTSQDLDVLLTQHFKKSMSLVHRSAVKS
ncbi:uncharacterized protein [Ambystoma mexicanum]|uniref:uncharacterized protein n=1 Tax=Ambystoma mexicanum TaxID=8296 RepID=UPI0037E7BEE9